jgi:hypothetical protein
MLAQSKDFYSISVQLELKKKCQSVCFTPAPTRYDAFGEGSRRLAKGRIPNFRFLGFAFCGGSTNADVD